VNLIKHGKVFVEGGEGKLFDHAGFLLETVILLIYRDPTKVVENPAWKAQKLQIF
jgi:hypothetical protein